MLARELSYCKTHRRHFVQTTTSPKELTKVLIVSARATNGSAYYVRDVPSKQGQRFHVFKSEDLLKLTCLCAISKNANETVHRLSTSCIYMCGADAECQILYASGHCEDWACGYITCR